MVLSKVNASCELNGKKSKFTQLGGGHNVHHINFYEILILAPKLPKFLVH